MTVVFDASANPLAPILHTMAWSTDILTSRNRSETRRSLRRIPANVLEFTADAIDPIETSRIDALLQEGAPDGFKVPFWCDRIALAATLPAASAVIPVSTVGYAFVEGEELILWSSPKTWELATIDTVLANSIELAAPTVAEWKAGNALIVPVKTGYLAQPVVTSRMSRDALNAELRFVLNSWIL